MAWPAANATPTTSGKAWPSPAAAIATPIPTGRPLDRTAAPATTRIPGKHPGSTMTGPASRCGESTPPWLASNAIRAGRRPTRSLLPIAPIATARIPTGGSSARIARSCHVVDGFEKVSFNHSNTRFPLTGKHAGVSCQKCHTAKGSAKTAVYKPRPSACSDCHADVHLQAVRQKMRGLPLRPRASAARR